jgi:hypothetical protein
MVADGTQHKGLNRRSKTFLTGNEGDEQYPCEFKILNWDEAVHPTYQEIRIHMIFDVKMEYFRCKARFVAGGHNTDMPHAMTYAILVSRKSVRFALPLDALNYVDVNIDATDNAYLAAPHTEKVWTMVGPEFGDETGKCALIVRALYCLKVAGTVFRNHISECMKHMG